MYRVEDEFYNNLTKQLVFHEGLRLKPYKCTSGKLTIGVGRNLEDRGITTEEAMMLLRNDIEEVVSHLSKKLIWRDLSEVRQRVLADMAFQLGLEGLMKFKETLNAIHSAEYQKAAEKMRQSRWYAQTPKRAARLAKMMATDQDAPELGLA